MSQDPRHPPSPDGERTVVLDGASARAAIRQDDDAQDQPLRGVRDNPLLAACEALLAIVPQLRAATQVADPRALRESLARGIREFEQAASTGGVPREAIIAARYVLCTFLDETAAGTPWGGGSWSRESLLVMFHNEAWGGEKVFTLLAKLAEDPRRNHDLIELIYVCVSLGFEGRYRVLDNGRAQLALLRERLHGMLRSVDPAPEPALSLRWQPAQVRQARWGSFTPFWVAVAAAAMLALAVFLVLNLVLSQRSDPVFAALQSLRLSSAAPLQRAAPVAPAPDRPRLAPFLSEEIAAKLVDVRDEPNRSVVTIRGDGFFEPGSAEIAPSVLSTLERIGRALAQNPGKVIVAGHTDDRPIQTARYPSNWHLSRARAMSVVRVLGGSVPETRMTAEGRAEGEPLESNATPAGRARNRRVEITLYPSAP